MCNGWGGPDDLVIEDIGPPAPGPGEVLKALSARGVADQIVITPR